MKRGERKQAQGEVVSLNCRILLVKEELDSSGSPCSLLESWKKRGKAATASERGMKVTANLALKDAG